MALLLASAGPVTMLVTSPDLECPGAFLPSSKSTCSEHGPLLGRIKYNISSLDFYRNLEMLTSEMSI